MRGFVLVSVLALTPVSVAAIEPIAANRPGQPDPPTVLAPGAVQIEGGMTFVSETQDDPNVDTLTVPQMELRLGVIERVELQLFVDGLVHEFRDGARNDNAASDIELDARVRLMGQDGKWPAVAIDFGLSFPTGSDHATSNGVDPEIEILYAWDIGHRWNLNGNFDFASESQGNDDSSRHFVFRPQLALGLAISRRFGSYVGYYGIIEDDGADQHGIEGGFSMLANDDLQLDVSAGAGLNNAAPEFFISTGIAWRIGRGAGR